MIDICRADVRGCHENTAKVMYEASGRDHLTDLETSSLINVNRAVYLSHMALLESLEVLCDPEDGGDATAGGAAA
jgi:hypothetical protein